MRGMTTSGSDQATRFGGSLAEFHLGHLLGTLERLRRSGRLRLRSRGATAAIDFVRGTIVGASCEVKASAYETLLLLLDWREGTFELVELCGENRLYAVATSQELVLEHACRQDVAARKARRGGRECDTLRLVRTSACGGS